MEIDPHRWERVQTLFHAALELPEPERLVYLGDACEDPVLLAEVLVLLEEDGREESPLERGLPDAARGVLRADGVSRTIGPYRVLEVIGEGGMGVVYLAERRDLGIRVAIKMLRDSWVSPVRRARFAMEQRTLAQLVHPGIAQLHDAATLEDGTPYFVMEYIEGRSLTDYCRDHRLPIPHRLSLFRAVCEAVQFAHRHAIVHRDLKPSNVLVTRGGDVKLLDFGISKQLENIDAAADQTQTGLPLMTPAYAAPEQLRGAPVGVHTDVYALGVILYELLTDRLPRDPAARTAAASRLGETEEAPERPSARARRERAGVADRTDPGATSRSAWADLDVLCLTAMHRDPRRRYRTIEALIRDLDHFRKGEPLEARADTLGYRAGKYLRRNRRGLSATTLVAVTIVALVGFYTAQLADERTRARVEAAKARQVSEYLIGLFRAGDPFVQPETLDVRTLLARGVDRAEALSDQPHVQAQMLNVIGKVYTAVSEYDQAEALLARALELRRASPADPLDLAETLADLAQLYRMRGAYEPAERYAREAVQIREQTLAPPHVDLANALDELGIVLSNLGRFEEGEQVHRRVLDMRRELLGPTDEHVGHSLNNLAVNLANQGDYAAAEQYLRESLEIVRSTGDPSNPTWGSDLANLGVVLQIRGNYAGADSALTEALQVQSAGLGDDHYETALTRTRLGDVRRLLGDLEGAELHLRTALATQDRVLDPEHRNIAMTRVQLARVMQARNRLSEAESLLREAIPVLRASLGERHELSASTLCALGDVLQRRGDAAAGLESLRRCTETLAEILPPDHDQLANARSRLGEALARLGQYAEAEPLLLGSHSVLDSLFGADHPEVRQARERIATLYRAWDRPEDADRYRGRQARASP